MLILVVYVGHEDASYHAVECRCLYCICERCTAGAGTPGGEVWFITVSEAKSKVPDHGDNVDFGIGLRLILA